MDRKKQVSIIIPAFNEERHLRHTIEETMRVFNNFGYSYEIIIVDDGSTDNTYNIARRLSEKHKNIIAKQNRANFGKGRSLKVGFRLAKGDYVVFLDADMDLPPAQLETFFDIMNLDNADVVIGSKRHPNSKLNYTLQRRIISSVYFFLIKIMFGLPIRDTQTGIKLFKYEVLKIVFPKILVKEFAFDLEILVNAHRLGYKIAEAPIVLTRQRLWSRIGIEDIFRTWVDTLAIWYRMYILKYYDQH